MIYVSSSCVKAKRISGAVEQLALEGFTHIELSGGTELYDELEHDLHQLKKKYGLSYLCHNYFPPPPTAFVLNLASLDQEVAAMSFDHCKRAIDLSVALGAEQFAFHAGFLINIPLDQIGKKIEKKALFDRTAALNKFHNQLRRLKEYAQNKVKLYIENNVLSVANYAEFQNQNPFFFTNSNDLEEALSNTGIHYLLDLAHLRVSCTSLQLDYKQEVNNLIQTTDYIHLSDNNGEADLNWGLNENSEIFQSLLTHHLKGKTITLETYTGIEELKQSYDLIKGLI